GDPKRTRFEPLSPARIESIVAVIAFDGLGLAVQSSETRSGLEADRALDFNESTREQRDHRIGSRGLQLLVRGTPDLPERIGIFEQGMLKAGTGSQKRSSRLAREAHGFQGTRRVAIGA